MGSTLATLVDEPPHLSVRTTIRLGSDRSNPTSSLWRTWIAPIPTISIGFMILTLDFDQGRRNDVVAIKPTTGTSDRRLAMELENDLPDLPSLLSLNIPPSG
jgi:hypothetical protein